MSGLVLLGAIIGFVGAMLPVWSGRLSLDVLDAARCFAALRELREAHGGAQRLPVLSMGMSHDFPLAIEHGATCVRIGTAIFGSRDV